MRSLALALAGVLGAISLGLLGVSLVLADDLADWALPGLAALAAIGANVMLMLADRLRRRSAQPSAPE